MKRVIKPRLVTTFRGFLVWSTSKQGFQKEDNVLLHDYLKRKPAREPGLAPALCGSGLPRISIGITLGLAEWLGTEMKIQHKVVRFHHPDLEPGPVNTN